MNSRFVSNKLVLSAAVVVLAVAAFLVYALAGLGAGPIAFAPPPAFVDQYSAQWNASAALSAPPDIISPGPSGEDGTTKITGDFAEEDALVRRVILGGESPDPLMRQFVHPDKAQRVRVASAFAAVNAELTHDEESGFADKRTQFWEDTAAQVSDIQNALFEALITSAEEKTTNYIPYTLAWMPGQGSETVEILAWAANHHPDPWVRRFSVFFVVEFGQNEALSGSLLRSRTHDPAYRVRREVLEQRFKRLFAAS